MNLIGPLQNILPDHMTKTLLAIIKSHEIDNNKLICLKLIKYLNEIAVYTQLALNCIYTYFQVSILIDKSYDKVNGYFVIITE